MSVRTRGTPSPASKFTSGGRGGQQRPLGGKKAGGNLGGFIIKHYLVKYLTQH